MQCYDGMLSGHIGNCACSNMALGYPVVSVFIFVVCLS